MLELRNEFIFAPIKTGYGNQNGEVTKKHLAFYDSHSKQIAAVIPEPFYLDKGIRELPVQMGMDNDDKNEGLQKLTDTIHKNGAKAIAHLNHPGRMANPKLPGNYYVSSTDKACEVMGAKPERLDADGMKKVINLFVDAAKRAEKTGFDAIEIQFGHGYLLAQFLSPKVNDRTDEYGGSFENRTKFPLEILKAVKDATTLPIIARISADEMIPDGIKLDEMIQFSKILKENDVELIHVSAGTVCNTAPWYYQHMFIPKGKTWEFAYKIQEEAKVDTMYLGQINTVEDIAELKSKYNAKYIALGRALIADENFVGKYLGDIKEIIRPCLACAEGCLGGVKGGKGLQCMVNPTVGTNVEYKKADRVKNIAVVGAGLAGLESAINLHKKGHRVTIFEKDSIGGQFNLAYLPPHKQTLKKIIDFYKKEIEFYNIPVVYQEAKKEDLKTFDELILATGAIPSAPPIKGLEEYYWAEILLDENNVSNKNVAVIGGGLIGTEVANMLLSKNNKVFIFELLPEIANGMEMIEQKLTLKALNNEKVKTFTNSMVKEIKGDTIIFEKDGKEDKVDNIDIYVIATGMKENRIFDENEFDMPVHYIGDADKVGKAQSAIFGAYQLAAEI